MNALVGAACILPPFFFILWRFCHVPFQEARPIRLHADRAAGGDRDHRRLDRPAAARRAESARGGQSDAMREQPAANRRGGPQLPAAANGEWPGSSWNSQLLGFIEGDQGIATINPNNVFQCPSRRSGRINIWDDSAGVLRTGKSAAQATSINEILNGDGTSNVMYLGERNDPLPPRAAASSPISGLPPPFPPRAKA